MRSDFINYACRGTPLIFKSWNRIGCTECLNAVFVLGTVSLLVALPSLSMAAEKVRNVRRSAKPVRSSVDAPRPSARIASEFNAESETTDAEFRLKVSRTKRLRWKTRVRKASVAESSIVDLIVVNEREVMLVSKKPGATTVSVWIDGDEGKDQQVYTVLVHVDR